MFPGISMKHLLPKLTERLKGLDNLGRLAPVANSRTTASPGDDTLVSHDWLWARMSSFLKESDIVIAETGGALDHTI